MRILFNTIAKFISQGLSSFADNFSLRSNTTGGLGTSTSGDDWTPINGTINVQSGAAKATTTPTYSSSGSAYPMSVVTMAKSDVTLKLNAVNQGSTAAIWVQDTDEWWGVVARAVQNSTPGNTNYGYEYAVVGNSNVYQPSNTTNYAFGASNTTNYGTQVTGNTTNYGTQVTGNTTNYGTQVTGNTTNYSTKVAGTTTNYSVSYTRVAHFNYAFTSSTTYSANFGSKYNSKYAIAYNRYTWGVTNYGYTVTGTFYQYNSTTNSSTWYNYGFSSSSHSNYGFTSSSHSNYGFTSSSHSNYGFTASSHTNYFYNSSSTTNYLMNTIANYGFQYGVTGTNATTYTVNQYIDIIQSTNSAVNLISSNLISAVATVKSIIVSLVNNQITTKAYSDNNYVTQIGSDLVYTATGAVVSTQFGIAISPSAYDQSDIIATAVEIDVL